MATWSIGRLNGAPPIVAPQWVISVPLQSSWTIQNLPELQAAEIQEPSKVDSNGRPVLYRIQEGSCLVVGNGTNKGEGDLIPAPGTKMLSLTMRPEVQVKRHIPGQTLGRKYQQPG
jgi:hypothetical protein